MFQPGQNAVASLSKQEVHTDISEHLVISSDRIQTQREKHVTIILDYPFKKNKTVLWKENKACYSPRSPVRKLSTYKVSNDSRCRGWRVARWISVGPCWPSHRKWDKDKPAVSVDTPRSGYTLLGVVSDQPRINGRVSTHPIIRITRIRKSNTLALRILVCAEEKWASFFFI